MQQIENNIKDPNLNKKIFYGFNWSFFFRFILFFIKFFGGVVLARILLPEHFGMIAFCASIIVLLIMLRGFQFETFLVQIHREKYDVFGTTIFLNLIFLLIILIIGILISNIFFQEEKFIFLVLLISNVFGTAFFHYDCIFIKNFKIKQLAIIETFTTILAFLTSYIAAINNYGVWSLVIFNSINSLLPNLIKMIFSPYHYYPVFKKYTLKEIFDYSKFGIVFAVSGRSYESLTTIAIKQNLGAEILGYFVRSRGLLSYYLQFFANSLRSVSNPAYSILKNDKQKTLSYLNFFLNLNLKVNIFVCLFILCFGDEFITLVYGIKWLPVIPLLKTMVLFLFFHQFFNSVTDFYLHIGKSKEVAFSQFMILFFTILTIFPLLKTYGVIGAIISISASYFIGLILMLYFIKKIYNIKIIKIILKTLLYSIVVYIFYNYFLEDYFNYPLIYATILEFIIILFIYSIFILFFDFEIIKKIANNIKNI